MKSLAPAIEDLGSYASAPLQLLRIADYALQLRDLGRHRFVLRSLESFHRQQLRKVIGIRYPATIFYEKLYDRTKTQPLRFHLIRS